jgi:SPP1 family phage portal protein
MTILRTDKDILTPDDIIKYIKDYEAGPVKLFDKLWDYYLGKNPTILAKTSDPSNPNNKTPVSYGRKIITTFTGYAYRPRYITYKSDNEALLTELQKTFDENNEHIKTSQDGRNTGIFGLSYELMYIGENREGKPEIKFSVIDPREFILLYDYSIEPVKKIGIRFYSVNEELSKVAVYYDNRTEYYDLKKDRYGYDYKLNITGDEATFFGEVPIVAYYLGQEMQGLIEPVVPLIDDYDALVSGAMNEFDRFSNAYLRLVKMSLTPEQRKNLKSSRVFEQLAEKEAVSFLTKDIPTAYIEYMTGLIRDQIHIQSHVPDLGGGAFADGISGVAVDRLMFDFENVVSNAEAEFDIALYNRIEMILAIYKITSRADGTFDEIMISHKRNKPANTKEYSEIALNMKNAGFSDYSIADYMPDDMIPDTDVELERQEEQNALMVPDVDEVPEPEPDMDEVEQTETEGGNGNR